MIEHDIQWLKNFFETEKKRVALIMNAGGCRELWLQGELFLYSKGTVETNARWQKFDLFKKDEFIFEVKLLGGDYQKKVLELLKNDFEKLLDYSGKERRYVLLVLDTSCKDTKLFKELEFFKFDKSKKIMEEKRFDHFQVHIWEI